MTINQNPVTRLRISYVIALGLIAVLTAASHLLLEGMIGSQRADGTVINVSGRQRMLSQKIPKAAIALAQQAQNTELRAAYATELSAAHELWRSAHTALQQGDEAMGLPPLKDPQIQAQFSKLQSNFDAMDEAVVGLLAGQDVEANMAQLLAHQGLFLKRQNEIVQMFEDAAIEKVDRVRGILFVLGGLTLGVLVLEVFLVFRPAEKSLAKQMDQLHDAAATMSYRARHDGLTKLANRAALMDDLEALAGQGPGSSERKPHDFAIFFHGL